MATFFDGLAQGIAPGLQQWGQRGQDKRVARAVMNSMAGDDQPPPPTGAAPPPPAAPPRMDPMAALAALKGGPSPAMAPTAPPPGPAPARPAITGPQPQPAGPPPGAPTGQPGADAPTGMAVAPGLADPIKEGQSLIQNLWKVTKAKNPGADPLTLMKAVESQIDDIKGVAPITKATMQGQIAYLRAQTDQTYKMQRLNQYDHDWLIKFQNAQTAKERADMTAEYQRGRLAIEQDREEDYSRNVDYSHEDRQASTAARITVANIGANNRKEIQGMRDDAAGARANAAINGKRGPAMVAAIAKIQASGQPVTEDTINALSAIYGDSGGSSSAPKSQGGGAIPSNVQSFAKQHGLTVIRRRADGKYDAKDKNGQVGVIG